MSKTLRLCSVAISYRLLNMHVVQVMPGDTVIISQDRGEGCGAWALIEQLAGS